MGKRTPSKWLTLMAAYFGLLMLYIDLFIVNVALPTIAQDFRAPLGTVSWTVSGYVLMIGVLPMGSDGAGICGGSALCTWQASQWSASGQCSVVGHKV